jgi:phosphoglycolate phosphatase-like HAD superfamily hydrolase
MKYTKLALWDYDGTLVLPREIATESMIEAAKMVVPANWSGDLPWDQIFQETKGTTEKNLARVLASIYGVSEEGFEDFAQQFYEARGEYLRGQTSRIVGRPHLTTELLLDVVSDIDVYPDSLNLLQKLDAQPETLNILVTGNPEQAEPRINPKIRKYFANPDGGLRAIWGGEAMTRAELIKIAIEKAKGMGFEPKEYHKWETHGKFFYDNVFYFGDSENDLLAGIEAGVRTVYIPEHRFDSFGVEGYYAVEPYIRVPQGGIRQSIYDTTLIGRSFYSPAVSVFVEVPIDSLYLRDEKGREVHQFFLKKER